MQATVTVLKSFGRNEGSPRYVAKGQVLTVDLADATKPALLQFANENDQPQKAFRVCRTVWFDAWKYTGEDHLLAALLRVIVVEMQASGFWQRIQAELSGPKKAELHWLDALIQPLTKFVSGGTYELKLKDVRVDTPLKSAAAFFDYFDESLSRLLASWVGGKIVGSQEIDEQQGVMVVFVDDLDRCLPEKTVQVLEAIKLFLDKGYGAVGGWTGLLVYVLLLAAALHLRWRSNAWQRIRL